MPVVLQTVAISATTSLYPNPCWLFLTNTNPLDLGVHARSAVDECTGFHVNPDLFSFKEWDRLHRELAIANK